MKREMEEIEKMRKKMYELFCEESKKLKMEE
jgi:hypothetical protein